MKSIEAKQQHIDDVVKMIFYVIWVQKSFTLPRKKLNGDWKSHWEICGDSTEWLAFFGAIIYIIEAFIWDQQCFYCYWNDFIKNDSGAVWSWLQVSQNFTQQNLRQIFFKLPLAIISPLTQFRISLSTLKLKRKPITSTYYALSDHKFVHLAVLSLSFANRRKILSQQIFLKILFCNTWKVNACDLIAIKMWVSCFQFLHWAKSQSASPFSCF